jgi:hypothetical protein
MKAKIGFCVQALMILVAITVVNADRLLAAQAQLQNQALLSRHYMTQSEGNAQAQQTAWVNQAQVQGQTQQAAGGVAVQGEGQVENSRLLAAQAQLQNQALLSRHYMTQSEGNAQAQQTFFVNQAQVQGQTQQAAGGVAVQGEGQVQNSH